MRSLNTLPVARDNSGPGRFSGCPTLSGRDGPGADWPANDPLFAGVTLDLLLRKIIAQAAGEMGTST